MTVNLSYFAGAGWQFFDNNGVPLAGGLLYTYQAGTTTPATTYTTTAGNVANSNPIVLDAAGRLANEIWLTAGSTYKFVLKNSSGTLIGTYDDIPGINDVAGALNQVYANLANTSDPTKGDAYIGFRQSNASGNLSGAIGRTVHQKFQSYIDVKDFGAVGDGIVDDAGAFQSAVNAAIATTGELFVPAGTYLIGTAIDIPFVGGIKIRGTSNNSLGTRSLLLQKSIEEPVLSINAINVTLTGLSFTTWAGNITQPDGTPIICTAVTSNSITLSADPWPGVSAIVWNCSTPLVSTDGTPYTNVLQISINGSFYASSVTKNLDGTVTLNNVKGANGTPNAEIANLVGDAVSAFVSLANASVAPANPNAGMIYLGVKENPFYEKLWFNQVTSAFTVSALGSGGGPGIGVGNMGFWSDIVCDQATYFVKGLGDLYGLQITNSQFFGVNVAFYAPYGGIKSSNFSNCQLIIGKMFQANTNLEGLTVTGCSFSAMDGYGYSNYLFNNGGIIDRCTFVGNNFGRSTDTVINTTAVNATIIAGNDIVSNGEGSSQPWLYIQGVGAAGYVTNSYLGDNNFAAQYGSNANRLGFASASPSVSGSTFGGEWIGYQTGTKVIGWLPVSFLNSWGNVGGGTPNVQYFKDQNGVVSIYGAAVGGGAGTVAFQLPAGYRPLNNINRFVGGTRYDGANQQVMFVEIDASGNVTLYGTVVSWSQINLSFPTR